MRIHSNGNDTLNPSDKDSCNYNYIPVKERIKVYNGILLNRPFVDSSSIPRSQLDRGDLSPTFSDTRTLSSIDSFSYQTSRPPCQLHQSNCNALCEDKRDLSQKPVRIFVGTWNCVYQDIEESVILKPNRKDHQISQRITKSLDVLSHWLAYVVHRFGHCHPDYVTYNQITNEQSVVSPTTKQCRYCFTKKAGRVHSTGCVSKEWLNEKKTNTSEPETSDHIATSTRDILRRDTIEKIKFSSIAAESTIPLNSKELDASGTAEQCVASTEFVPQDPKERDKALCRGNNDDETASERDKIPHAARRHLRNKGLNGNARLKLAYIDNREGGGGAAASLLCSAKNRSRKFVLSNDDTAVTMRQSTLQLKPLTEDDGEPLQDWIQPGYDVYIIALQETLSSSIFTSITKYLQNNADDAFERVPLEEYKISGYGDGAFLHMKSTSIAVWVKKDLLDSGKAKIGRSKVIPLSLINRSKGVVTFQMDILGQAVCVVGCHMPTRYSDREKAATYIMKKLPELYGDAGSSLEDVFHHILWTGDFNFRVSNISAEKALDMLNNNMREKLFTYDEFNCGRASVFSGMNFVEGKVSFFPTYKKRDDRDIVDRSSLNWADAEYHTRYETQWYKGRSIKERVPSWTDRVLKWSVPDFHTCLIIDEETYRAVQPTVKNILLASDHSPVGCGLRIWAPRPTLVLGDQDNLDTNTN